MNELRKYYPIWNKLKQEYKVSVTAPRALHPRIIKAVCKEKWKDLGYKLEIEPKIAVLSHCRSGSIITFILEIKTSTLDLRSKHSITAEDF